MEDGTVTHRGGNGDRHNPSHRRKTVSGAPIRSRHEEVNNPPPNDAMRFPWSSPSAPASPPVGHKRSLSGSILARLNFLRTSHEDDRPPASDKDPRSLDLAKSGKSIDDDMPTISPTSPKPESAMIMALQPAKVRKRKGSLRKTALLGGRRIVSESRERKNNLLQSTVPPQDIDNDEQPSFASPIPGTDPDLLTVPADAPPTVRRQFSTESPHTQSSSSSGWSESAAVAAVRLSLVTEHKAQIAQAPSSSNAELGSPLDIKSPTSQTSYASTTDDDDLLIFDHPTAVNAPSGLLTLQKPLSSAATSCFPSSLPTTIAHASNSSSSSISISTPHNHHQRSPLSHAISAASLTSSTGLPSHSYTSTESWGWIILFATWLTFTVGMGSCLEIWSWAWDVGETPYAPPELEDDPTLPIVGYYPALIVLTGVVAWVWITVAWVGMKYFRHAKIEV